MADLKIEIYFKLTLIRQLIHSFRTYIKNTYKNLDFSSLIDRLEDNNRENSKYLYLLLPLAVETSIDRSKQQQRKNEKSNKFYTQFNCVDH